MTLALARRLADAFAAAEPAADAVQGAVRGARDVAPAAVRDAIDGRWLGAPLHPALTDVPVGAFTAAALLDLAPSERLRRAADGALLVGVLGALPAAATGLNDWAYLRGEEKRIGVAHAILNTVGLGLNVASLALRRRGARDLGRALSLAAFAIGGTAAHLGGQLSFGLGVRVNRTAWEAGPDKYTPGIDDEGLAEGELARVEVDGVAAVVSRSAEDGRLCAIAATCSHLGGPLDEGERDGDVVTCPWHGSRFDLCTGEVVSGPAVFPQPRYEARRYAGRIEVRRAHDEE